MVTKSFPLNDIQNNDELNKINIIDILGEISKFGNSNIRSARIRENYICEWPNF